MRIQRANKSRVNTGKARMMCLMEIWERVRSEVTKFMNGNKKLL